MVFELNCIEFNKGVTSNDPDLDYNVNFKTKLKFHKILNNNRKIIGSIFFEINKFQNYLNKKFKTKNFTMFSQDFRKLFLNIENLILNSAQEEFNQIFPEQILV